MIKKLWSAVFCVGLLVAVGMSIGDEGKPWFDIHNCGMCKNMAAEEGLMDNLNWETHKISNGMLNDEAVVKQIHDHAQHTIDAYEQWLAAKGS